MTRRCATTLSAYLLCTVILAQPTKAQLSHGQMVDVGADPTPSSPLAQGEKYVSLAVPRPIARASVDRWADVLHLSEAQLSYMSSVFEEYQTRDAEFRERVVTPLWDWAVALGPHLRQAYNDPEWAEEIAGLFEANADAVDRLIQHESATFFTPIVSVLTPEQADVLHIVRNRRLREIYSATFRVMHTVDVDLAILFEALRSECPVVVNDSKTLEQVLREYEQSRTTLCKRRDLEFRELQAKSVMNSARGAAGLLDPRLVEARNGRLRRQAARSEAAINELNEMYLPVVAQHLPPGARAYYTHLYRLRAFPQVYPNPYELREVCVKMLAHNELSDAQRGTIRELYDRWKYEDALINEQMTRAVRDEMYRFLATLAGGLTGKYEGELNDLNEARARTASDALAEIQKAIDNDVVELFQYLEEYEARTDRFGPKGRGTFYFPAYPSDPVEQNPSCESLDAMAEDLRILNADST